MFNKVSLVGRLARENEFKSASGGFEICENTLAMTKKRKDGKEKAIYIKIKIFGNAVNVMRAYTKKGDKIGIIGELDYNQWQGQDGKTKYEYSIVVENLELLGSPKKQGESQKAPTPKPQPKQAEGFGIENEIPF